MHVVHIIWHLEIGGGELFLRDLAHELTRRGIRQHVLTVGPGGPIEADLRDLGIPVRSFQKSTKLGLGAIAGMASELKRIGPDLVQTHGEAGVIWGLPAVRLARLPSVSLMYLNHDVPAPNRWTMRWELRWPVSVLAGSADVAAFLRDRLEVDASRLRVVPCGINLAMFRPRATTPDNSTPVIVSVGRLIFRKGHHVLIDAFKSVTARYPAAELHIAGSGPERGSLERRARDHGLGQRLRFLGTVYPTTSLLERANVFVFPSLIEPQGLALLEAYACGVPVVASRTGGIVEMLEHEVDGLLVQPGDPADLASAILRMLDDEALQRCSIEHARSRLTAFDVRNIANQYVEIYDEASQNDVDLT